jgi:hypothetical protein
VTHRTQAFHIVIILFSALILVSVFSSVGSAQEQVSYDPYVQTWKHPDAYDSAHAKRRDVGRFFARILEQPIRPIGYGIGKTAEWVERTIKPFGRLMSFRCTAFIPM